jgi:uncharacterized protein (TIGR02594 family)
MSAAPWMDVARAELGVKETSGPKATKRILEYFQAAGHGYVVSDETAWCSAFMNFVMAKAGLKGTMSLAARSWLNWGHKVEPQPGAVLIFSRGNSWQGHVTLMVGETATHYLCLGGNQGDCVSISRRPKSGLLGARMPASMATSYKAKAGALGFAGFAASQADYALPYVEQAAGLPGLANYGTAFQYLTIGLGLISFAYMLYREWKDVDRSRNEGAME